jgi:putative hydrolase of the HAD superfamily
MSIRALLFDLDDTLLETHHAHQTAIRISCERAAEHHPEWTPERLQELFVATYRVLEEQIESGELEFQTQLSFRQRTWEDTLRACGLSPALGEELAHVYLAERRKRYRLYDDVAAALDAVVARYRLVLVTNGLGELQREKVTAVGLERWFPHVVVSGEVRSWKPHAGIFQHALKLAEVEPSEALMIGDNLHRDVAGASALGIRTAWIRRYPHLLPVEEIQPDFEAEGLPALVEYLANLN